MQIASFHPLGAAFSGLVLAMAVCVGCGGAGSTGNGRNPPSSPQPSASISPATATINAGASVNLTATVSNPSGSVSCNWSATTGTFSGKTQSGNTCSATYDAPASVSSTTTASVSFTGAGANATAAVTINPVVVVVPSAVITPATSTVTAGNTVSYTVTVSNGTSATYAWSSSAGGSFSNQIQSGSTYTATYTAPAAITAQTTDTVTFTGAGATAHASVTVNPVPQSLSWNTTAFSANINASTTIPLSALNASTSCPPSAVTITVDTTDTIKTTTGGQLAYWGADSSHATYGTINAGNTFSRNGYNTYTVTAKCGIATTAASFTAIDVVPTIVSVSPNTVKSTSNTHIYYSNTNNSYIAGNETDITQNQWFGTEADLANNCSSAGSRRPGSTTWVNPTSVWQGWIFNDTPPATYAVVVYNPPVANGTGGGYGCLDNAFTIVANDATTASNGVTAFVDQGTSTQAGMLHITSNGVTKSYPLGRGAGEPVVLGTVVYVPDAYDNTLHAFDTTNSTMLVISTAANITPVMMASDDQHVYLAAEIDGNRNHGAIYRLDSNSLTYLADASGFTGIAAKDGKLFWTATREGNSTDELNVLDTSNGSQRFLSLSTHADSVAALSDGSIVVWQTGEKHIAQIDLADLREGTVLTTAKGILSYHDDAFALADGAVGSVSASQQKLQWKPLGVFPKEDLYSGFAISRTQGNTSLLTAHKTGSRLVPLTHAVTVAP